VTWGLATGPGFVDKPNSLDCRSLLTMAVGETHWGDCVDVLRDVPANCLRDVVCAFSSTDAGRTELERRRDSSDACIN